MSRYYDPMQVVSINSGTDGLTSSSRAQQESNTSSATTTTTAPLVVDRHLCASTHQWYAKNLPKLSRTNKITSPVFAVRHTLVGPNAAAVAKKLKQCEEQENAKKTQSSGATSSPGSHGVAGGFFSAVSSLASSSAVAPNISSSQEKGVESAVDEGSSSDGGVKYYGDTEHSQWYFRLILLKGLEASEKEEDDSYGVFLEYLPGHSSNHEEDVKNHCPWMQEIGVHPHQSKVTVVVKRPEGGGSSSSSCKVENTPKKKTEDAVVVDSSSNHHNATEGIDISKTSSSYSDPHIIQGEPTDAEFTSEHKAVAFKTLIPGDRINADCSSSAAAAGGGEASNLILLDGSLLIEVTIQTQLPTLEDEIHAKAAQASTSFWKSVSTIGSTLSSLKHTVAKSVMSQLGNLEREEHKGGGGASGEDGAQVVPWEEVPSRWRTRSDEWRKLLTHDLPMNDYTFTQGRPERVLTSDETVMLAQVGVMAKTVMTANSTFDFDRDVHEGLLALTILRKQRYNLVPRYVTDEKFWGNYFWKCAALGSCSTEEQSKVLLTILNTPPAVGTVQINTQLTVKEFSSESQDRTSAGGNTTHSGSDEDTQTVERKKNAKGHSGDAPSPTSPNVAGASSPASGSLAIFPPVTHGDIATMVKEASEASSLMLDLLQDEKQDFEGEDGGGDRSMWDAALRSCQSQKKSLGSVKAKVAKFALSYKNAPIEQQKDIESLATPLNAALFDLEEVLKAVTNWEVEVKLQKDLAAIAAAAAACAEPSREEGKQAAKEESETADLCSPASVQRDQHDAEVGQEYADGEAEEEPNQKRQASWSADDEEAAPEETVHDINQLPVEGKKEAADAKDQEVVAEEPPWSIADGTRGEDDAEEISRRAPVGVEEVSNVEHVEEEKIQTLNEQEEGEKVEPKQTTKTEKKKGTTTKRKKVQEEDDGFDFDDFPTIEDTKTPLRDKKAISTVSEEVSTGKKSSSSDFSKMPWEEDQQE